MIPFVALHYDTETPAKMNQFSTFLIQDGAYFQLSDLKEKGYTVLVLIYCEDGIRAILKNPPEANE